MVHCLAYIVRFCVVHQLLKKWTNLKKTALSFIFSTKYLRLLCHLKTSSSPVYHFFYAMNTIIAVIRYLIENAVGSFSYVFLLFLHRELWVSRLSLNGEATPSPQGKNALLTMSIQGLWSWPTHTCHNRGKTWLCRVEQIEKWECKGFVTIWMNKLFNFSSCEVMSLDLFWGVLEKSMLKIVLQCKCLLKFRFGIRFF